jgi:hypothetical protein
MSANWIVPSAEPNITGATGPQGPDGKDGLAGTPGFQGISSTYAPIPPEGLIDGEFTYNDDLPNLVYIYPANASQTSWLEYILALFNSGLNPGLSINDTSGNKILATITSVVIPSVFLYWTIGFTTVSQDGLPTSSETFFNTYLNGATGATGPQGDTGQDGPTGPTGPSVTLTAGDGITVGTAPDYTIATIKPFFATYYKSVLQNLSSPNTDITFDLTGSWNNDGGCITHVNGTTGFTVVTTGFYQLEFHALVDIGTGTWIAGSNKAISIDITRSPTTEVAVIRNSSAMAVQSYVQSVNGSFYLVAGDVINLSITNTFTNVGITPPHVNGVAANLFDLNTFFTWTLIST